MDITYFKAYDLDWLYDLLTNNKFSCSEIEQGYYSFTDGLTTCFINLGEELHPNVDFRLAVDNVKAYNKIGQIPVSIDVAQADESIVLKWINFLGTDKGFTYSNTFEYLDDGSRPCYCYSK